MSKVSTTLPQSTLEDTISEKWLQFIMQLENPRKGSSISCFSWSSLSNVGKINILTFSQHMIIIWFSSYMWILFWSKASAFLCWLYLHFIKFEVLSKLILIVTRCFGSLFSNMFITISHRLCKYWNIWYCYIIFPSWSYSFRMIIR